MIDIDVICKVLSDLANSLEDSLGFIYDMGVERYPATEDVKFLREKVEQFKDCEHVVGCSSTKYNKLISAIGTKYKRLDGCSKCRCMSCGKSCSYCNNCEGKFPIINCEERFRIMAESCYPTLVPSIIRTDYKVGIEDIGFKIQFSNAEDVIGDNIRIIKLTAMIVSKHKIPRRRWIEFVSKFYEGFYNQLIEDVVNHCKKLYDCNVEVLPHCDDISLYEYPNAESIEYYLK